MPMFLRDYLAALQLKLSVRDTTLLSKNLFTIVAILFIVEKNNFR